MSNVHSTQTSETHAHQNEPASDEPLIRAVGGELPGPLGPLLATLVVIVSLGLTIWSLIATWSGTPHNGLPLFATFVAGTVVSLTAIYARRTFSYVIALIGAAAWLWISILPLVPIAAGLLQAVSVTVMVIGVVIALEAVKYTKMPRF
ncbi:hypothetical protein OSC27_04115 [Microbacterium sp. STN6]|uniref:hypothetical protein n=1 Tax=Microbacterium sp. STN6 TaxID=2995588 RepID=UPI00226094C2|nr:hypothetical protein [Microbacterium sp. STN6]MCX7521462.1 hypothetical protein [Microbacterium sp. STN6]